MTAEIVPAAKVAEVFQLLAEAVGTPRIDRQAARIERDSRLAPRIARQIAEANTAITVRTVLAGLLSPSAGGVTADALDWAAAWLRRELDQGGEQS